MGRHVLTCMHQGQHCFLFPCAKTLNMKLAPASLSSTTCMVSQTSQHTSGLRSAQAPGPASTLMGCRRCRCFRCKRTAARAQGHLQPSTSFCLTWHHNHAHMQNLPVCPQLRKAKNPFLPSHRKSRDKNCSKR